jgi:hypothetical protein
MKVIECIWADFDNGDKSVLLNGMATVQCMLNGKWSAVLDGILIAEDCDTKEQAQLIIEKALNIKQL